MRYVRFGNSGLQVSRLGLDCHALGVAERDRGWDPLSYDGRVFAIRTVHAALDAGINMFDTSPDAGGGRAESLLGESLRGRRQGVLLASRIATIGDDSTIEVCVQASTRRLRTERIDIVHVNDTLFDCPEHRDGRLRELQRLQSQGRIGHIGLVVTDPGAALPLIESGYFSIAQLRRNVAELGKASRAIDACQRRGLGISVAKSLASGVLRNIVDTLGPAWKGNKRARECCLKFLLGDRRIHMINVGMRWEHEVAQNAVLVSGLDAEPEPPRTGLHIPQLGAA